MYGSQPLSGDHKFLERWVGVVAGRVGELKSTGLSLQNDTVTWLIADTSTARHVDALKNLDEELENTPIRPDLGLSFVSQHPPLGLLNAPV